MSRFDPRPGCSAGSRMCRVTLAFASRPFRRVPAGGLRSGVFGTRFRTQRPRQSREASWRGDPRSAVGAWGLVAVMTVHKLSAGDGYTYLTRQVASMDVRRTPGESLADYYTAHGNPPGVWMG